MDFPNHRLYARAASPNRLINLGNLGRYRKSLLANPLPSPNDSSLDVASSPVVARLSGRLLYRLPSRRWEDA